ncbi:hypothetical protein [Stakelama marina]|uniref:Type II secretion system protein GspC N-terminal domain-containing protein n=1 Tax=Stakelama marina TaxID=2826939 RepID=A0A8T4IFI7_9SPHN|nr:hypothetical protein [Stakelama marina]MBR0551019.1 hypothetical protein [Stakelama marina]
MASLTRFELGGLAAGALIATACPLILIPRATVREAAASHRVTKPLAVPDTPRPDAAYRRELFAPALTLGTDQAALPADAPQLLGIVGRLGSGAVALVRTSGGDTRSLGPGDSVDGWRLVSLAIDAAYFERGGEQIRVPVPSGDDSDAQ